MAVPQVAIDLIARDKASATFDRVGKNSERTGSRMKKALVAGTAVAGAALLKFGADSVRAFSESEQSQKSLELAFKKFPATANLSITSLRNYNSELAKKITFDDDSLASGQATLAQFGLTGQELQKVTPLLADFATKTGRDIPDAATLLGKAYMGNTKALKALGINYKATGDKGQDFANINRLLEEKVGGAAEAMGDTAAGKAAILRNQFGELQETAGSKLLPVLIKVTDAGLKLVDWVSKNQAVIVPLVVVVGTIIAGVKAWTIAQAALNIVLALNPIGLVVIGVAALAAGLIVAWKRSEKFRSIVKGAFDAVRVAVSVLWDKVKSVFDSMKDLFMKFTPHGWILGHLDDLVGVVKKLPGRIASAASGMWDGIKNAFKSALNWIIGKWNGLEFSVPGVTAFGKKIGGFTLGVPDIPMLAEGGIVTRPTIAMIGEQGAEAVVPLGRGFGGGITINLTVQGSVVSDRDFDRKVLEGLREAIRRGGGLNRTFATGT